MTKMGIAMSLPGTYYQGSGGHGPVVLALGPCTLLWNGIVSNTPTFAASCAAPAIGDILTLNYYSSFVGGILSGLVATGDRVLNSTDVTTIVGGGTLSLNLGAQSVTPIYARMTHQRLDWTPSLSNIETADVLALGPASLTWNGNSNTDTPGFDAIINAPAIGDVLTLNYYSNSGGTTLIDTGNKTLVNADVIAINEGGTILISLGPQANGSFWARLVHTRTSWTTRQSNLEPFTVAVLPPNTFPFPAVFGIGVF